MDDNAKHMTVWMPDPSMGQDDRVMEQPNDVVLLRDYE